MDDATTEFESLDEHYVAFFLGATLCLAAVLFTVGIDTFFTGVKTAADGHAIAVMIFSLMGWTFTHKAFAGRKRFNAYIKRRGQNGYL